MDLLAGSAERISAVSVTGAKASRRICVSGSLYRIVRGQDFRGRFNQASATRLSSIATTLWYNGFKHGCGRHRFPSQQARDGLQDRCRCAPIFHGNPTPDLNLIKVALRITVANEGTTQSGRRRRAMRRWPPSAAQTARAVFPHAAFTKTHDLRCKEKQTPSGPFLHPSG
jgi:hypothetical protein